MKYVRYQLNNSQFKTITRAPPIILCFLETIGVEPTTLFFEPRATLELIN